jgi:lipoprotein-anchoring transpeptidase ErfK/SrfK
MLAGVARLGDADLHAPPRRTDDVSILLALLLTAHGIHAPEVASGELIGAVRTRTIERGESLIELAMQHGVGYSEIMAANPGLDPFVPTVGATAVIPAGFILPRASAPRTVVVNVPEMRLYYFPLGAGTPVTFPIGIGTDDWETPLGRYKVIAKQENPTWRVPASIRRENPELPASVPPGPENPLGTHALRLDRNTILIHGTDTPWGVGRKATHGCVRLYPDDIPILFGMVPVGTPVLIVSEPVKVGLHEGRVYVEVQPDDRFEGSLMPEAKRLLGARKLLDRVDQRLLATAIEEKRGVPVDVTQRNPDEGPRQTPQPLAGRIGD